VAGIALYLTDFADAGVMVPVCTTTAVTLLLFRQRQIALSWIAVTAAVWALMLVLKLSGHICETLACTPPGFGVVSPSGHVAASSAAYGGLLGLMFRSAGRSMRQSCVAAVAIATVVGVTRVVLHEHTIAEVIVGGVVGVAGAILFTSAARGWLSGRRRALLLGVVAASMMLFHGTHLTWEPEIRAITSSAVQSIEGSR